MDTAFADIGAKRNRVICATNCLAMINRNPMDFFMGYVTVHETWVHHYTPETKEQSKQWTFPCESAPKKAKTVPSAGKVMATVVGFTRCDVYYSELLDRFDGALKEKRPRSKRPPRQFPTSQRKNCWICDTN